MDNEELENIDSTNDDQETLDSSNEEVEVVDVEEDESEEEYSEREKQLYARLKKAEAGLKEKKVDKTAEQKAETKTDSKLSIFDQKAIFNADIDTQEDLDEILDYADRKGISVAQALESTVIKATLAENAQIRKSAQAVNTGTGRRASGTVSDERLMADAKKGKMPESADDIAKLARMRIGKK